METKAQTLGKLELEVLKIVWNKPGCTVPEATEVLAAKHGYARTTILTVIQRLHKKGFLTREKNAGVFRYYATEKKTTVLGKLTRQFVDSTFEGSSASLVQHLTNGSVSTEELSRIRKIIDDALAAEGEAK
jgi:predicted transcriptional regulator